MTYEPSGFVVMRTPLLPFDDLLASTGGAGLRAFYARPEVREALFLASPTLAARLDDWPADSEGALIRYLARMTGRPTPFGLFAGISVGEIGQRTRLRIAERSAYERHTRLDMEALATAPEPDAEYRPNTSLYRAGGRIRYVETRPVEPSGRTHHLVDVRESPALAKVLDRAAAGAKLSDLADAVNTAAERERAERFVRRLAEAQVLLPDAGATITGAGLPRLHDLDREGLGIDPELYRGRRVQVDLVKPASELTLGHDVVADLLLGVEMLRRFAPRAAPTELDRFRDAFERRYGSREVPLVAALDPEFGVGYGPRTEPVPLLDEIPSRPAPRGWAWTEREDWLLRRLRENSRELLLDDTFPGGDARLPDAFGVLASVGAPSQAALDAGEFSIEVRSAFGPSGARLLGRFAYADAVLHEWIERHLRQEEALEPDAVFAEVVHLPDDRVGNILLRPVLREYELPYLGRSGAPRDRQLTVHDLLVSLVDGRLVLRSRSLRRRVLPRLTAAHAYSRGGPALYRCLCALQAEGASELLSWQWGALEDVRSLPRVRCGRVVLSPARWRLPRAEVAEWRKAARLPRYVVEARYGSPVDLDDPPLRDAFLRSGLRDEDVVLREFLPSPEDLCATGPEGRFVHELVVPFVRTGPAAPQRAPRRRPRRLARVVPESDWLYAKLYCGPAALDRALVEFVRPAVKTAAGADRWFFLRYNDPDPHVRLRFRHAPPETRAALGKLAEPAIDTGWAWRLDFDEYVPEVERYGGRAALDVCERIFLADSEAVLGLVEKLETEDERWRLALLSADLLLDDLGYRLDEKLGLTGQIRAAYARTYGADSNTESAVSRRFRDERSGLEALLAGQPGSLRPGLELLRARSRAVRPLGHELRALELTCPLDEVTRSLLHMSANRLLRGLPQPQELVIAGFLGRLYRSRLART